MLCSGRPQEVNDMCMRGPGSSSPEREDCGAGV
jgi:hypothetical protein